MVMTTYYTFDFTAESGKTYKIGIARYGWYVKVRSFFGKTLNIDEHLTVADADKIWRIWADYWKDATDD